MQRDMIRVPGRRGYRLRERKRTLDSHPWKSSRRHRRAALRTQRGERFRERVNAIEQQQSVPISNVVHRRGARCDRPAVRPRPRWVARIRPKKRHSEQTQPGVIFPSVPNRSHRAEPTLALPSESAANHPPDWPVQHPCKRGAIRARLDDSTPPPPAERHAVTPSDIGESLDDTVVERNSSRVRHP
jgi:hypothetical protein